MFTYVKLFGERVNMKKSCIFILSYLAFITSTYGAECVSPTDVSKTGEQIRKDIASDELPNLASTLFAQIKSAIPVQQLKMIQDYGKPISGIERLDLEQRLTHILQRYAQGMAGTEVKCL